MSEGYIVHEGGQGAFGTALRSGTPRDRRRMVEHHGDTFQGADIGLSPNLGRAILDQHGSFGDELARWNLGLCRQAKNCACRGIEDNIAVIGGDLVEIPIGAVSIADGA